MSATNSTLLRQANDRVTLLSAGRVRSLLSSDGLQRLLSLIRRLVAFITKKLGIAASYILPGGKQSASAGIAPDAAKGSVPEAGLDADMALVNAAMEKGSTTDPLSVSADTDAQNLADALAAVSPTAPDQDPALELHLTGLPQDIAELKTVLMRYIDILMTAGPAALAAGDDQDKAERIARRLGEEAARIHFLQRISAKQIALLVDHLQTDKPQYIGLSPESIVDFLNDFRKDRTRHGEFRPESTEGQLMAVLEANDAITEAFNSQIRAQIRLSEAFAAEKDKLTGVFLTASERASSLLEGTEARSRQMSRDAGVPDQYHAVTTTRHERYGLKPVKESLAAMVAKDGVGSAAVATTQAPAAAAPAPAAPPAEAKAPVPPAADATIAKATTSGFGSVSNLQPDADDAVDEAFESDGLIG